jgi:hypothetical protein
MRTALLFFFLLVSTLQAWAQDEPNPADIRVILPLPDKSTSNCIGNPSTPLCGVETLLCCTKGVWNMGCRGNIKIVAGQETYLRIEYVFREYGHVNKKLVRQLNDEDDEYVGSGLYPWLTPDAFQARLWERSCPSSQPSCENVPWEDTMYTVSPLRGRWHFSMYGLYKEKNWFVNEPIFVRR